MNESQTHFSQHEPFLEQPRLPGEEVTTEQKPSAKKRWLVLGGVGFLIVLVIIGWMIANNSDMSTSPPPSEPAASPTLKEESTGPEAKITALEEELKAADPSQQVLPFPPVNMNIQLDTQDRR